MTEDKLSRISEMLSECKGILKMANAALPSEMEEIIYEPGKKQTGTDLLPEPNFTEQKWTSIQQRLRTKQQKEGQQQDQQRKMDRQQKHTHDKTI